MLQAPVSHIPSSRLYCRRFLFLQTMALHNYLYARHAHDIITESRINKTETKMEDFEDFTVTKPKKCLNCANCKSRTATKDNSGAKVSVEVDVAAMADLTLKDNKGRGV